MERHAHWMPLVKSDTQDMLIQSLLNAVHYGAGNWARMKWNSMDGKCTLIRTSFERNFTSLRSRITTEVIIWHNLYENPTEHIYILILHLIRNIRYLGEHNGGSNRGTSKSATSAMIVCLSHTYHMINIAKIFHFLITESRDGCSVARKCCSLIMEAIGIRFPNHFAPVHSKMKSNPDTKNLVLRIFAENGVKC